MKTCVVRRRFWTSEVINTVTLDVDLEPNFGTAKGIIIFYVENSATTDAFQTTLPYVTVGIGFAQASLSAGTGGTLTTVMASGITDNVATTDAWTYHTTARIINAFDVATRGTTFWRANTVTFLPDKLRFAFSASTPQTNGHLDTLIWAITGDDVSVAVGTSSFNTTSGSTRLLSGLGWQPDLVFLATQNTLKDANSNSINTNVSFGAATRDPNQQGGFGWNYQDASVTNVSNVRSDSQKIIATGGAIGASITINSDGWSMYSQGTFAANTIYQYFAIKGLSASDFAFINYTTPTSTGANFSGLGSSGFIPETIIGGTTYVDTQNTFALTSSAQGVDGFGLFAGMASTHSKLYNGDGTITYSTASTTVTGAGTTFFKFAPGFRLYTSDGSSIGTISSVASTTSLTLVANALLNGTAAAYTYAPHRQGTLLFGDDDNQINTATVSRCSSGYSVYQQATLATPIAAINGYLSTPDTRPGFEINFNTVDATPRFGFLVAFRNQNASTRRGDAS